MRIAILGVPGSGKTCLVQELRLHLPHLQVSDNPLPAELATGHFDLILLTGLDLPGCNSDMQRHADTELRASLQQAGLTYGVVYGQGAQRLHQAQRLIAPEDGPPPRWTGVCEKCADPDCEYRLFTALKRLRAAEHPLS
ncbi:hypothetical protein [Curvibacter delicatus]|jgi:hypothetical protein|uniref:hypothetical protein n=1 Tax=Curvibacter delicatus TaxID=80879 RepID=UPI000831C599|nr:hypothetical protein [Curvibacter delicatus]